LSRRAVLLATLVLCTAGAVLPARAGSTSAQIDLVGVVPEACDVQVRDNDVTLDLAGAASPVKVATLVESCNRADGYVVKVTSAGGGMMSSGAAAASYAVSYGGEAIDPAKGTSLTRTGPASNVTRDLVVTVPGSGGLPSGVYRDTLTVEISAR
jgi:hypothetical protein